MTHLITLYGALIRINLAVQLQYRAAMVIWLMGMIVEPVMYLVVWRTVAGSSPAPVAGYGGEDFAAYYIAYMLVNHMTFTWIMWEYEHHVRAGTLAIQLVRPAHPIHADIAANIAYKIITQSVMLPTALVLAWGFSARFPVYPGAGFVITLILAAAVRFALEWTLALAAFWLTRVSALNSAYFTALVFLSGRLAPLELLPPVLRDLAYLTPFPWMTAFPVEVLLGRHDLVATTSGALIQIAWLALAVLLARCAWSRGIRRFSAVGT